MVAMMVIHFIVSDRDLGLYGARLGRPVDLVLPAATLQISMIIIVRPLTFCLLVTALFCGAALASANYQIHQ